jgi:alkaline phosphatase D
MANLNRRDFLKNTAFLTGAAWLSHAVLGCSNSAPQAKTVALLSFYMAWLVVTL